MKVQGGGGAGTGVGTGAGSPVGVLLVNEGALLLQIVPFIPVEREGGEYKCGLQGSLHYVALCFVGLFSQLALQSI